MPFKGNNFRVASPKAKLNVDQATDMLKERGWHQTAEKYSFEQGAFFHTLKHTSGKSVVVTGKQIGKFLSVDTDDIEAALAPKSRKK